ncbi:MAG: hypothetical protein CFE24_13150 [Flavobacterium sp. BFFFF2]|nr:MAG: hypothetical protein CFE24_13150 [Flavobacterium sp. BFFFF2]
MPIRSLQSTSLIVICLFLLSAACTKKEPITYYEKPVSTNLDPTFAWLDEVNNSYKPNFLAVFYKYYNQLIKEHKIEQAAHVLDNVCNRQARNLSFDPAFTKTVLTFAAKYQAKLPAAKTLFINSYFSALYKAKGDNKTAISYALKTTKVDVTDYNSCKEKADAYADLAFSFFSMGNQNTAIKYNFNALECYNRIRSVNGSGRVNNCLAGIYYSSNDYVNAEIYYNKAIGCFKKAGDLDNVFIALGNKLLVYEDSNNKKTNELIDSTYSYFKRSGLQADDIKITVYCNYIGKLIKENRLNDAKKNIDEIAPIVKKLNNINDDATFEGVLFDYKIKKKEKFSTEELLKKLPALIENEDYQRLKIYYLILKENAVANKDYKTALFYDEKKREVINLIGNDLNANKVIELDKKYQTEKKIQQIATQEKEIATKNATIAWLAFLLLAVFIIVVIYQNRQKQKKLQQDNLNAQLYTKQLLEKVEEERKRIASDLHDSVSHELLGLKNGNNANQQASNQKIDAIINDIRSISRNLHPIMFDKIGLKASVEQLLERAQSVNDFMVTAEIDYQGSLDNSDELQLYRIIQEALSNVIKYAEAMAAKITISEKEKAIYVEIKDNGKGFSVQETLNGSHSFGLHNIIERSRAIGGEANITSTKNGTTVAIEIKKKQ